MKLSDCDATFWSHMADRRGVGIIFACPLCAQAKLPDHRRGLISVPFENPIDGGAPEASARNLWKRTGDTLETLTLAPSLDASGEKHDHGPGWHGHVRNGLIEGGGVA